MHVIQPSRPGYNFTTADLQQAQITPDDAARMILQAKLSGAVPAGTPDAIVPLLAGMLRQLKPANARHVHIPFEFAAYQLQQIVSQNDRRKHFMIQVVGTGDLMVLPEPGSLTLQDYSSATAYLDDLQKRAIRIVAGGYYEPLTPPTNPVTIFTLADATNGVVVDGQ